jgi:AcrR family transcriptional regulator
MPTVNSESGKRPYVSAVRAEQAAATRARVAEAAARCFAETGWSGTTLAQIARAAGVSPQAVHLSIGPKPALLKAALVAAVGAGEADDPELEQEVFRGMLAPGLSIEERARACALASHAVHRRAGRLFAVLAQAAQTDEDLAAWRQSIGARRMAVCRALTAACEVPADRRPRVSELVFVLSSTSVYYEFDNLGWSDTAYDDWLVGALVGALTT